MTTVGAVAIARTTFDLPYATELATAAFDRLTDAFAEVVGAPTPATTAEEASRAAALDVDVLVVIQATFADSTLVRSVASSFAGPLVVWALPEARTGGRLRLNSLCGLNLAAYSLAPRPLGWVYRHPEDPETITELRAAVESPGLPPPTPPTLPEPDDRARMRAQAVAARMAGTGIGVVGRRPEGFEPCDYDPVRVDEAFGMTVTPVPLTDLFIAADAAEPTRVAALRRRLDGRPGLEGLDPTATERSLRLHLGLADLVARHRWAGVATRCWPECFTEYGGAACTPQALLNESGVPGCCEADAYGTITSLMLQHLTGSPAFVADLVDGDRADDTAVFWHCGLAPASMADGPVGATVHSNRRLPLLNEFALRPGRVTIARLSQGPDGDRMTIGGGQMLRRPRPFSGTAGVLRFDSPVDEVLTRVVAHGLEHHYGLVYGDVRAELVALADHWGLPVVPLA